MPRRVGSPKAFVIADTVAVNAPASRSAASEASEASEAGEAAALEPEGVVATPDAIECGATADSMGTVTNGDGFSLGLGRFRGTPVFYLFV